jgi:DNA polymerase-4
LVISVGIAPVKMAAKILSDMSKPDGILAIGPEHLHEFLAPLPVERLWGVGPVMLERMHRAGLRTIGDLAERDVASLRGIFDSFGPHLYELAHGRDPREVVGDWQRKSYGEENTFEHDLAVDGLELKRALLAHGEAIGRRLRADHVRARTITLKLKLARPLGGGRYPLVTRSVSLESATDDTGVIARSAIALLARVPAHDRIRLAGIHAHKLERTDAAQLDLFDGWRETVSKASRLNRALDRVTERFGTHAVTRGMVEVSRAAPSRRIK